MAVHLRSINECREQVIEHGTYNVDMQPVASMFVDGFRARSSKSSKVRGED